VLAADNRQENTIHNPAARSARHFTKGRIVMGKYVLSYSGGSGMAPSEAEQKARMAVWGAWFGSLGPALVDGGAPFGPSKSVGVDGTVKAASGGLTGYSIISAANLDEAVKHAKSCPVLKSGGKVEVYETIPM
jgi:hypothetical protein